MAIARSTSDPSRLPPWAQETARQIELLGLEGLFLEDPPLADMAKVIQIRDDVDLAPKAKVEEYAEMMRGGDQFPPVIITTDGWLVDGATRTLAAQRLRRRTFPAFRLRNAVYGDNPPATLVEKLVTLGGGQNMRHGTGLTVPNRARIIEWVAKTKGSSATAEDIARQLSVRKNQVRDVLTAQRGRERCEKLGVDLSVRPLSWTHMIRLGAAAGSLNDEPFTALARLTVMTSLSTTELNAILVKLGGCTTDEERMKILRAEANSRVMITTGMNRRPPVPAQARQHLGWLEKNAADDPSVLVEHTSLDAAQGQQDVLQKAHAILRKAIFAQSGVIQQLIDAEEQERREATA